MKYFKLADYLTTGVVIATVLEVVKENASRASTAWRRMGGFGIAIAAGTIGAMVADAIFGLFTKRKESFDLPPQQDMPFTPPPALAAPAAEQRTSWAQDMAEQKSG